jgi:hypothetical protein
MGRSASDSTLSTMKNFDVLWTNPNAVNPLGMDFNFSVYRLTGQYSGRGYDWRDPVEVFDSDRLDRDKLHIRRSVK